MQVEEERVSASVEIDFFGPLALALSATNTDIRHSDDIEDFIVGYQVTVLDRDIERLRAGLSFLF